VELFMITRERTRGMEGGEGVGAVYILYFSLNVFFFVFGVEIPSSSGGKI
jgi:hypothetical protein